MNSTTETYKDRTPVKDPSKVNSVYINNSKNKNLKLFYTNTGSFLNKLNELKNCIDMYELDIICICDTHLHSGILDAEIQIPGFNVYRQDRNFNIHNANSTIPSERGGSVIYVRSSVKSKQILSFLAPDSVAIEIETAVGPIAIACVYRSQSLSSHQNDEVTSAIRNLCVGHAPNETIVIGDFNLPEICWVTGTVGGSVGTGDGNLCSSYMNIT